MQIEVASVPDMPSKEKGDLLEVFAEDFLRIQNYEVERQVRVTAVELDLLCKHQVKGLTLYVECKAHRDPLSANELTKLLGTIGFRNYDEGWLISAGALGKDAKGFQHEWEQRSYEERRKLTIYTPDRIIDAFAAAGLIQLPPSARLPEGVSEGTRIGDWVLLVTQNGRFWAAPTIEHGVPSGVVVVDATTGHLVTDAGLLREIGKTDTSLATLDLEFAARKPPSTTPATASTPPDKVVEVEHGDSWADYRPARPQDFVGRVDAQKTILSLLEDVRKGRTSTRVFAITGDSGMGKSSLIAKLRARSRNPWNRGKYFIYAVDSRAATNATYIAASLIKALREAALKGFGEVAARDIEISDHADPLSSASIQAFLESLGRKRQIVCLVIDQFEELYSKPDLFPVFEEAQSLFLSAVSAISSLVLGFAWRTDSTVQQDHPAYYMWHRLSDHRLEVALGPFPQTDSSRAVTLFEKELGETLRPEIRRQVFEISQGYPWLLKKMCIHLFQQLRAGATQAELVETLDVAALFDRDLQQLTHAEDTCLRVIARTAPADWYEVLDTSGPEVLRALQDKRLVVRSGDRVNVYWDIFREYILSRTVPSIPFSYIPSSPSLDSFLHVASALSRETGLTPAELSKVSGLGEKTVGNVLRDLRMFGVAAGSYSAPRLASEMPSGDPREVLERVRRVLSRHALTLELTKLGESVAVELDQIAEFLRSLNRTASHSAKTWMTYAERMAHWLVAAGLLVREGHTGWRRKDAGGVVLPQLRMRQRVRGPFSGDAPPQRVIESLKWLSQQGAKRKDEIKRSGYRNAVALMSRLGLVSKTPDGAVEVAKHVIGSPDCSAAIWQAVSGEESVRLAVELLRERPTLSGSAVGKKIGNHFSQKWGPGSNRRIGNALRRWAEWVIAGEDAGEVPTPKAARADNASIAEVQGSLFQ